MEQSDDFSGDWQIVSSVDETGEEKMEEKCVPDSSKVKEEIQASGSGIQDIDQGNAALHDSSSSDIEMIDETEENTTPCVLPSSSLSISSTIDESSESCLRKIIAASPIIRSSSVMRDILASPVTGDIFAMCQSEANNGSKIEESRTEESEKSEEHSASDNDDHAESPWTVGGRTIYDWFMLILQYIENMTSDQWWSIAITVTLCLSVCFTINVTNIIAQKEKGNVVSQMKEMIEELKNDNKLLRDQMMSEMKNDKMLTSFEHQIRELKKENSKLNHMLFDVVKVLEKQKDSQEKLLGKKESEFLAPFKKEINKLKEHINILKFDNEELQKQLVRMRYASYSQGGKHADDGKTHGKDKNEHKADKTKNPDADSTKNLEGGSTKSSETEIPMDLGDLRKWNELIDMLANELGIFDLKRKERSYDDNKKKDWGWNTLKRNLKGTFDNFNNINISDLLSKYFKYNEKAMSNIYKSVSNYFSSAQENAHKAFDSFNFEGDATVGADVKSNIWDTLKDLRQKWAEMKNKFYSFYLKKGFSSSKRGFEKSGSSEEFHKHSGAPKEEERNHAEETSDFSEAMTDNDRAPVDPERKAWQFERAAHRADLRDEEEEPSVNWFLKKGKHDDEKKHEEPEKHKWTFEF